MNGHTILRLWEIINLKVTFERDGSHIVYDARAFMYSIVPDNIATVDDALSWYKYDRILDKVSPQLRICITLPSEQLSAPLARSFSNGFFKGNWSMTQYTYQFIAEIKGAPRVSHLQVGPAFRSSVTQLLSASFGNKLQTLGKNYPSYRPCLDMMPIDFPANKKTLWC